MLDMNIKYHHKSSHANENNNGF